MDFKHLICNADKYKVYINLELFFLVGDLLLLSLWDNFYSWCFLPQILWHVINTATSVLFG